MGRPRTKETQTGPRTKETQTDSLDNESTKRLLQWHPAFCAGIQIELEEESEYLIFNREHQLGRKPKQVDLLIIKKDKMKKKLGA